MPIAGDAEHNTGVVVGGILNSGPKALGKVAVLVTDYLSCTDVVKTFEKVTGSRASYVEVSDELWTRCGET